MKEIKLAETVHSRFKCPDRFGSPTGQDVDLRSREMVLEAPNSREGQHAVTDMIQLDDQNPTYLIRSKYGVAAAQRAGTLPIDGKVITIDGQARMKIGICR